MANDRYRAAEGVRVREVGDETLLLDDRSGQIHQLNATASFIWRQLDGETSINTIANRLVDRFDVEDCVATNDVAVIVNRLRELELLSN